MKPLPMIYGKNDASKRVLYFEKLNNGFKILILNMSGNHPCAYIMVPAYIIEELDNKYIHVDFYDKWTAPVHGGFTYSSHHAPAPIADVVDSEYYGEVLWLGWDYAHYGDFTYCEFIHEEPRNGEHVWSTEEILEEAYDAIEELTFYGERFPEEVRIKNLIKEV